MGLVDSTLFSSGQTHRCLRGKGLILGLLVAPMSLGVHNLVTADARHFGPMRGFS